jgi:hypothetical protein
MVYYSVSRYNEDMFLVGILSWWYGHGWQERSQIIKRRIIRTSDYFSIGLLVTTLFSPYRQISASEVSGSLGIQLRGFFDKTLSRIIGAVMRVFVIIIGLLVITFQAIIGGLVLISWAMIPLFPVGGLLIWILGWVPLWR